MTCTLLLTSVMSPELFVVLPVVQYRIPFQLVNPNTEQQGLIHTVQHITFNTEHTNISLNTKQPNKLRAQLSHLFVGL